MLDIFNLVDSLPKTACVQDVNVLHPDIRVIALKA